MSSNGPILQIEHKLGFAAPQGMRRTKLRRNPHFLSLLRGIRPITNDFQGWSRYDLESSCNFADRVKAVAATTAPEIWSDHVERRDELLVWSWVEDWDGLLVRDLYWSDAKDREIITQNIKEMIMVKIRYRWSYSRVELSQPVIPTKREALDEVQPEAPVLKVPRREKRKPATIVKREPLGFVRGHIQTMMNRHRF